LPRIHVEQHIVDTREEMDGSDWLAFKSSPQSTVHPCLSLPAGKAARANTLYVALGYHRTYVAQEICVDDVTIHT